MTDELEDCKRRNEELEEENELLRESAEVFGELADRLNGRLKNGSDLPGPSGVAPSGSDEE